MRTPLTTTNWPFGAAVPLAPGGTAIVTVWPTAVCAPGASNVSALVV